MKGKLSMIILISFIAIILILFYIGLFSEVVIEEMTMGPYSYAYVSHTGPYKDVLTPMEDLKLKLREAGFTPTRGFGVYYDDPQKIAANDLESDVGALIPENEFDKIEVNQDNFNFQTIEASDYLVAEFKIKNAVAGMFIPVKVNYVLSRYLKKNNLPYPSKVIEIFETNPDRILFLMEF